MHVFDSGQHQGPPEGGEGPHHGADLRNWGRGRGEGRGEGRLLPDAGGEPGKHGAAAHR